MDAEAMVPRPMCPGLSLLRLDHTKRRTDFRRIAVRPMATLTDDQREELAALLTSVGGDPYRDFPDFQVRIATLAESGTVPAFLTELVDRIRCERTEGTAYVHVIGNCPIDEDLPELGYADPVGDKHRAKKTFVGEAMLSLVGGLAGTPLLAYAARFGGQFFTDVVAIERFAGQQTGYSDGEVVYHNDRTAHPVRADYITLLGMRCPQEELVFTGFVSGDDLVALLDPDAEEALRREWYFTPFDVVSREASAALDRTPAHAVLTGTNCLRYVDTHTTVAPDAPAEAWAALHALKTALTRSVKTRHRMRAGDLLTFANQHGLHCREHIEITDRVRARSRWLLKTYSFRDDATAERHAGSWVADVPGLIGD